mgnify:FL=1
MNNWIFNDITWCGNSNTCNNKECYRHLSNRRPESKPDIYSMALFEGTDYCPSYFNSNKKED